MKNLKTQLLLVLILLTVLGIGMFPSIVEGKKKVSPSLKFHGNGNKSLKTCSTCCIEQRQGYSQSFIIDENSPLIEVPEGKCYVLLRIYSKVMEGDTNPFEESVWTLTVNGETFLDEISLSNTCIPDSGPVVIGILKENFPDKTVVVKGGETLGIIKNEKVEKLSIALIGYFYNTP